MCKQVLFWVTEYLNYFSLIFWGIKLFLKKYDVHTVKKGWIENVIIIVVSAPVAIFCAYNYRIVSYSNMVTYFLILYFYIYFSIRTKQNPEKIITFSAFYVQCLRLLDLLIVAVMLEINKVSRYISWNLISIGVCRSVYMCLLALCYFIIYIILSKVKILDYLDESLIYRLFICIYTMLGIFCFCRVYQFEYMEQLIQYWTFYLVCLFIFCGIFLFYFVRIKEEEKNRLLNLRNDLLESNYQSLRKAYDENRMIYHDFKNHMLAVNQLLREWKNKEAQEYIQAYINMSRQISQRVESECKIVDIIVNYKITEAIDKNINFKYEVDYIGKINIMDIDMCALLANLLDNAIEACEKLENKSRWIYLKIKSKNDMLFIILENSTTENKKDSINFFQTTKKDKIHHGLGIKSIENVVQKYEGYKEYHISKDKVQIFISLPVK